MRGPGSGNRTDGPTDGRTVDESIHRSEGGYGWGGEAMRAQLSLSLTAGMREGSFPQTSLLSPSSLIPLTRSVSLWLLKQKHVPLPFLPSSHPRHRQLSCHSCHGGRRGGLSGASRLPALRAPPPPRSSFFSPLQRRHRSPFLRRIVRTLIRLIFSFCEGDFDLTNRNHGSVNVRCACGGVDVVRRQTDEQRSAANAMR